MTRRGALEDSLVEHRERVILFIFLQIANAPEDLVYSPMFSDVIGTLYFAKSEDSKTDKLTIPFLAFKCTSAFSFEKR